MQARQNLWLPILPLSFLLQVAHGARGDEDKVRIGEGRLLKCCCVPAVLLLPQRSLAYRCRQPTLSQMPPSICSPLPLPPALPLQLLAEAALAYGEENLAPSDVKGESTLLHSILLLFQREGVSGRVGGWAGGWAAGGGYM